MNENQQLTFWFGSYGTELINDLVEFGKLLKDLISGIVDLFAGRPKDEATQQSASTAVNSVVPAFRLYGLQLIRMLDEWGVVTSASGGSARQNLNAAYNQAIDNGVAQGYDRRAIAQGLTWILSRDGQAGNNPPAIYNQHPPNQVDIWGPPKFQQVHEDAIAKANLKGLTHGAFDRFVDRYTWQHMPLGQLFDVVFVQPGQIPPLKCSKGYKWNYAFETCVPIPKRQSCPTGYNYNPQTESCDPIVPPGPQNCPTGTTWSSTWNACLPDPTNGTCPPGYLFNVQTGTCDPAVPPPPPACPAGQQWNVDYSVCAPIPQSKNCPAGYVYNDATQQCDPLGPPQTGPDDACCQAQVTQLTAIAQSVAQVAQELATDPNGAGFANVVAALGDITTELTNILDTLTAIANEPQTPVNLQPVIDALNAFGTCICQIPQLQASSTAMFSGKLEEIATAIANAPATDVSGLVDVLNKIFTTLDPKAEVYSTLASKGFIDSDVAQLAGAGDLGTGLVGILGELIWRGVVSYVKFWLGIELSSTLPKLSSSTSAEALLTDALTRGLTASESLVTPVLKPLLDSLKAMLVPSSTPSLGNVNVNPDNPIAAATGVALSAGVVAYLAAFAGIDEGEPLAHIAELVSGAVGFEELRDVQIGPLVRFGIARVAEMNAKNTFRQELPGAGAVAALLSRGLVDKPTYDLVAGYDGLPTVLADPTRLGAYQGMNPRILMRLVDTGLFADADIADELTFAGMRPASQHRFLLAAQYMATDPQRKALITQIEAAYQAGILSDADLTSNVESAEHNTDKANLILAAAKWKLQIAETKLLETEYSTLFKAGLIDDPTYRAYLAGIQLQPAVIDIRAGLVEAQANASLHRKELADSARLENETKRDARRTAMKSYADGLTNEATLAAALIATGLTVAQVASWTALASLNRSGSAKWLFGLQLQPQAAQLLRERLSALTDQRKRLLITDTAYTDSLKALGLPEKVINALRAAADAMVSPKTAATRIVVETN